jgi:hypothetical protein
MQNAVPPRLLYFAARRKAYPVILEHGLRPGGRPYVPLATTEDLALRIGKRRDPKPILLTVLAAQAHDSGIRETPQPRKISRPTPSPVQKPEIPEMAGSFLLDSARDPDLLRRQRSKQKKDRKRQISQERRRKKRRR